MDKPVRKPLRLKDYDYSAPGAYFITVCTGGKRCILSEIRVGDAVPGVPRVILTQTGQIVDKVIRSMAEHYDHVSVERFVIMPNHIHLLIRISEGARTGVSKTKAVIPFLVSTLKGLTTRMSGEKNLWQRSFYDHVVRNEDDYRQIAAYIDGNPARWAEDRFFPKE